MFRTLRDVLDWLSRCTDYERMAVHDPRKPYDLRRMLRLAEALGRPDRAFPSLHVAGTKGKGTTSHFAEALLRAHGFRTGLYTSPHLTDLRERIRIDGVPVAPADLVAAFRAMEPALRRIRPTFFEAMTAAAFLVFKRRRVDWAVIEVGLGGRLDATNVVEPRACAITRIDYDHMDRLGRTLGAIAGEKAGILKPGVPAVSAEQRPAARRAIARRGPVRVPSFRVLRARPFGVELEVEGRFRAVLPVLGRPAAGNAALAVALVEAAGVRLDPGKVRAAFAGARLPGRIEAVARRPWVVVDVAHNPLSARALADAVRSLRPERTLLVFGASADKDARGMLRELGPAADLVLLVRARVPRAAEPEALARHLKGRAVLIVPGGTAAALETARALAGPRDAVVVSGSFYVAGEALAALGRGG
jgi:dihydrofolate synthase/folylpolyglutamate synthase